MGKTEDRGQMAERRRLKTENRKQRTEKKDSRDAVGNPPSFNLRLHSSRDISKVLAINLLPDQILLNAHSHRWFDFGLNWIKELIVQNMKNTIKVALRCSRND